MKNANIVLVGFMGTGKTTVGRIVADRLGRELVDMDTIIEERETRAISDIFAQDGEPYFRDLERALTQELAGRQNLVITAGGGIVLNPDNIRDFSVTGLVVCLRADPDEILRRVQAEDHRPLLENGDKANRIRDILADRQPLYDAIAHQIDTTSLSPEGTAREIVRIFLSATE
ncbi:MAG: shikimate kinase [Verrucomicrobia bacterium]|nr:shikimate kinase [Verrucomicrobiota bacterium]